MKSKFISIMQASLTILSAFIGAGFATGVEISTFFVNFNIISFHFAIFCCLFIFLFIYLCLSTKTNIIQNRYFNLLEITIFAIFSASMLSSLTDISKFIGLPFNLLTIFSIVLSFVLLSKEFNSWSKISAILGFIIIIGIMLVCITNLNAQNISFQYYKFSPKTILNPVLYVCMNSFCMYPVVCSLNSSTKTKTEKLCVSIITSITIFIFLILILMCISKNNTSMPMLSLAKTNKFLYLFYSATLIISIFTTLISCLYGMQQKTKNLVKNKKTNIVLCLAICISISTIGFSKIVNTFYPIVGLFGAIFLIKLATKKEVKIEVNPVGVTENKKDFRKKI